MARKSRKKPPKLESLADSLGCWRHNHGANSVFRSESSRNRIRMSSIISSAHSSPFSLDNTSLSLCSSDSESSDSSPELGFDPSHCPSVDVHSVTSSKAVLSTEWMFSGNFVVDKEDPYAEFSMEPVNDLFKSKSKSALVNLIHNNFI